MRELMAVMGLLSLVACGGSGPTGPSSDPTGPVGIHISDNWDGQSASNGSVTINGTQYRTGGDGRVTIPARVGTALEVDAPGYLHRRTVYRRSLPGFPSGELTLLNTSVTPFGYVQAVVYSGASTTRLRRPNFGTYTVGVDAAIQSDGQAMDTVSHALGELSDATGGNIRFVLSGTSDGNYRISIDPSHVLADRLGSTASSLDPANPNILTGGTISLRDLSVAKTNIVLHEMGHGIGLNHSNDSGDIMFPNPRSTTFSEKERRIISYLVHRLPGTEQEDDDTNVRLGL